MMHIERLRFAAQVRDLRKRLGLTQTQLAQKLGVSSDSIKRWENIRHAPSKLGMQQVLKLIEENKYCDEQ